jgi:RNA polymerase sigma-70 factor (ECF subfamily)
MLEEERRQRFETLLTEQLHARAWHYATRQSRTREDAQDLLQEALVRAYRKLHQLREPGAFKPWLFSIIRSCARNLARPALPQFAQTLWFQAVQASGHADLLSEPIAEALAALPPVQCELLALFYLDGLSLEETGRVLGVSPQVVGQRLHRARAALRREFARRHASGLQPTGN